MAPRLPEELDVLPSHRSVPRKNRRGGSELTPLLSAQDGEAPPADLIESAQPEDLIEEDVRDVRDVSNTRFSDLS